MLLKFIANTIDLFLGLKNKFFEIHMYVYKIYNIKLLYVIYSWKERNIFSIILCYWTLSDCNWESYQNQHFYKIYKFSPNLFCGRIKSRDFKGHTVVHIPDCLVASKGCLYMSIIIIISGLVVDVSFV